MVGERESVISYFLPFTKRVREANRLLGLPATEWLYGRIEGERFNVALREFMAHLFIDAGYDAVAPALDARYKVTNRRSNWSERHVAYVAGLGTFSLSCSLITKLGSAGRLGSVVTSAELTPTPRSYQSVDEYCTRCGSCIPRCPPLAITERGKDHAVCSDYLDRVKVRYSPRYGCGKCQTGVPCEYQIPAVAKPWWVFAFPVGLVIGKVFHRSLVKAPNSRACECENHYGNLLMVHAKSILGTSYSGEVSFS